jgi:hypothetical protein
MFEMLGLVFGGRHEGEGRGAAACGGQSAPTRAHDCDMRGAAVRRLTLPRPPNGAALPPLCRRCTSLCSSGGTCRRAIPGRMPPCCTPSR